MILPSSGDIGNSLNDLTIGAGVPPVVYDDDKNSRDMSEPVNTMMTEDVNPDLVLSALAYNDDFDGRMRLDSGVAGPVSGRGVAALNSPVEMSGVSENSTPKGAEVSAIVESDGAPLCSRIFKRRASTSPKDCDNRPDDVTVVSNFKRRPRWDFDETRHVAEDCPAIASTSAGVTSRRLGFPTSRKVGMTRKYKGKAAPIVISSSDDDGPRNVCKGKSYKGRAAKGRRKSRVSDPNSDDEDERIARADLIGPADMAAMAASALGSIGLEWLAELDECRLKSNNLNGRISGRMKSRFIKLGDVIFTLVGKAEAGGDPSYLRRRTTELTKQLRDLQRDHGGILIELQDSRKRIKGLENRIRYSLDNNNDNRRFNFANKKAEPEIADKASEFMESDFFVKDNALRIAHNVLREHGLEPFADTDIANAKPHKDVLVATSKSSLSDKHSITSKSKREVELTSQIDALVEERRNIRRELVGGTDVRPFDDPLPPRDYSRGPRVISNVQLVPPRSEGMVSMPMPGDTTWQSASGSSRRSRKNRNNRMRKELRNDNNYKDNQSSLRIVTPVIQHTPVADVDIGSVRRNSQLHAEASGRKDVPACSVRGPARPVSGSHTMKSSSSRASNRRIPKTSAVCIRRINNDGPSYAEMLKKAREKIQLSGLGIEDTRIRWTANGSVLIEVAGNDMAGKADMFANQLKDVLDGEAIITRPAVKGELRIWGLDDSVCTDEVICVVANSGGCLPEDVAIGNISKMPNGLGLMWARCPLAAAVKVASSDRLRIGWSSVRVELLNAKPIQCFKCWHFGHVRNNCKADIDRSFACFRCGQMGHRARDCTGTLHCVVCAQMGCNANHRIGSVICGAPAVNRGNRNFNNRPARRNGANLVHDNDL